MGETQYTVTKRNGSVVPYSYDKIYNAINKAFKASKEQVTPEELGYICHNIMIHDGISVEEIQDQIERELMGRRRFGPAKAFMLYRAQHAEDRMLQDRLDYMEEYVRAENAATGSETDANANVTLKNVANQESEVWKKKNRQIQRRRMKQGLQKLFPDLVDRYEEDINNRIIYVCDEASSPALKAYCSAVTLYPLMLDGTGNVDGVTPSPPNDIQSFSGQVTNLVFLLSSQVKGAIGLGDYFPTLNFYVIKEFGDKWYDKLDNVITTDACLEKRTVRDAIRKGMKQFIYGINQPAGNRSYNSPFSNISYYDRTFFNSLFENFCYPDGTKPEWKAIDTLQRIFMELHRELRLIKPLTFPVTTMAMVHDNDDIIDKEYKKLCADEWAKGGSFFAYISNNASALASCCFSGGTKFLWKSSTAGVNLTSFKDFYDRGYEDYKENFEVYHNGSWVKGKVIKLPNRPLMYKVVTLNNKEFYMTDNHVNVTLDGEKETRQLSTDDYLMFSTLGTHAIPENDEHLTYAQGFMVGTFLGNGCSDNLDTSSEESIAFIQKWTNCKPGTSSCNKQLNLNCLLQSTEFRKGILDGLCCTDKGNSNICCVTSSQLAEDMEILIMSLGMQSVINVEVVKGELYNTSYSLYCVRWHEPTNQRVNNDLQHAWIKKNNSIYFKIKSIERIAYDSDVYCIECNNQNEPYFTLPCGLITHNCRVLNEVESNTFSSTLGLTGIMTGSCNVITLNINRIVQNFFKENPNLPKGLDALKKNFEPYFADILHRVYKYHITYKTGLYDMEDKKMFANCNAGYIYIKKLYSTIGMLGYSEAAEFLGLSISNNDDYKEFLSFVFGIVKTQNAENSIRDSKRPFLFNTEAVPGENMAVKFYQWDKGDGYWVPKDQNLYSSYFFKQWDKNISVLDKLKLHGGYINKSTDGGQACHIHLSEHLSVQQYTQILNLCIKDGVNYFTFNIPMSECKDCGHTVNAPIHECPKCGGKNIDWWVRIIGFLRPISAWSKERQIEASKRVYSSSIE